VSTHGAKQEAQQSRAVSDIVAEMPMMRMNTTHTSWRFGGLAVALALFWSGCSGDDEDGGSGGASGNQKCKSSGAQSEYCICTPDGFGDGNADVCPRKTDHAGGICCFKGYNTTIDKDFCACEPFDPTSSSCTQLVQDFSPSCPLCAEVPECTGNF
jgi:hypothetical protein